jgi:hypothetical protein
VNGVRFVVVLSFCACTAESGAPSTGAPASGGTGTSGTGSLLGGSSGTGMAGAGGTSGGSAGLASGGTGGVGGATGGVAGTGVIQGGTGATTGGAAGTGGGGAGTGASAGDVAAAGAGTGGTVGTGAGPGEDALAELRAYLAIERAMRPVLGEQPFATVPLTKTQADTAKDLLFYDHAELIRDTRQTEADEKSITIDGKTLRYDFKTFGAEPVGGHSLVISLHGGGEADPSVNDEQWENQKVLYEPEEGLYLAPRAPTNTWNLWHEAHIDGLLSRLIENFIVLEGIDSNRVYVMGYSAGGDGVYQLGPRMADSWAAASMMAGHPNDAKPDSLRNIGFTIHVGALDTAYDRNLVAGEWGTLLDDLQAADPQGYEHEVQVHANKPHWMDLEDAVAVPWMAAFTRDPAPARVVWLQDDVPHEQFYWLAVPPAEAKKATKVVASVAGQAITLDVTGVGELFVRLSDALVDLDQPVTITEGATTLFTGPVPRTIGTLAKTVEERGDPALAFPAEVAVTVD